MRGNVRSGTGDVALDIEKWLAGHIGEKVPHDLVLKKAGKFCMDHGLAPGGTASNSILMLEYSGFLEPVIRDGYKRPHEYIVRGDKQTEIPITLMTFTELIARANDVIAELSRRCESAVFNNGASSRV